MRLSRGVVLVLIGVVLCATTLAASAATAPSRNVAASPAPGPTVGPADDPGAGTTTPHLDGDVGSTPTPSAADRGGPRVLVGSQGGGTNWQKQGSVYRLDDHDVVWKLNDRDSYFDVTRLSNGHVVAAFMHNGYETGCAPYDPPCPKTGFRVIDPSTPTPTVVSEFTFPLRGPTHSEVHDVEPLPNGGFVFSDMEYERIAVVENGAVVWQWNASGFYDAPPDATRRDWLHINDVDYLGDGRFLVSVRNANQLLVVERGAGVVEVINADTGGDDSACTTGGQLDDFDGDGEVRCGDPSVMDHQHNPQWLGPGRVLVADSDNDRIVELRRTESGWTAAWTLTEAGGLELGWPRDADRLENGNTLVTDSLNRRVFEVTPGGRVVWSYATPLIPYEADPLPRGEVAGAYEPTANGTLATVTPPGDQSATGGGTTVGSTADGTASDATGTAASTGSTGSTATETTPRAADTSTDRAPVGEPGSGIGAADVPGLSLLLVGVKAVFPRLPIWFGELQLLVTVCSLGLAVVGLVDHHRGRD
jgi:hypothetical protein